MNAIDPVLIAAVMMTAVTAIVSIAVVFIVRFSMARTTGPYRVKIINALAGLVRALRGR